ncbi:acyltransferase family protein [Streptomyces sp. B1866]|uniref:acyltransferase family protein n=1 Tax=Streptomyces sp. B1866 TaxID=3075431 RepID=UPI0028903620|nr:acyltransferase family protein [Streptomyces sp. B1866]MDT3396405.1 acyltransferase family protein [Streptomyces sp. B1866]
MLSAGATDVPTARRRATGTAAHPPVRLDIQGLRAVAVTLVVLSHAEVPGIAGGYVGVDVFFVISGFLITSLLTRELAATGGISLRRFYARRALRLLPASTLVAVATLGGALLFLSKIRFTEYAGDALAGVLYAENLRLASTGTDYLAEGGPPSPYRHFWSLAVEEQFYLLWPLLLLLVWRLTRRAAARRRRRYLAAPLAALCLASFWQGVSLTGTSAPWAYFGSHARGWELGAGALLALGAGRCARLPAAVAAPLTWLGLGCVGLSAVWFDAATPYPGYHALLPVAGAVLVLAGGCAPSRFDAGRLLGWRPAVWLGGLSYGWYLWHWPLLVIGPKALDRQASVPLALALGAVALLLAWATLRLVENPVRFHAGLRDRPGRGLAAGLGLSAAAVAVSLVAAAFPPPISSGEPAPVLRTALATAPDPEQRLADLLRTSGTRLPGNLSPGLAKIKDGRSAIYRDGCHVAYGATRAPLCVYGDRSSRKVVVLLGDSHAAQWFPALERLATARHWKLVSMTKASCKLAAVTTVRAGRPYRTCGQWRRSALAAIARLRPSLVVASSADSGTPVRAMRDPRREWAAGFRATYGALTRTGARVAVLLDTPWPRSDAVECAAVHPLHLGRCANQAPRALHDPTRRQAVRDAARSAGAVAVDPLPWLCVPAGTCPVAVGDTFVYRDDNHVSEAYAAALAPVLGARLTGLLDGHRPGRDGHRAAGDGHRPGGSARDRR